MVGVIFGAAHSSWSAPNSSQQQTTNPAAPPVAPPTVCGTSATNTGGGNGGPALCMLNQSMGTSAAAWIAQGRGFAPGTSVTVSLTWNSPPQLTPSATFHHTTLLKPVVAADGSLRLDISRLFPGPLRLGLFTVEVTGSDGSKVRTMFVVIPPGG